VLSLSTVILFCGPVRILARGHLIGGDETSKESPMAPQTKTPATLPVAPGVRTRTSAWCPNHKGDASWSVDLIWEVLHEKRENHSVYEVLTGEQQGPIPWDMSRYHRECGQAVEAFFRAYFPKAVIYWDPYYVVPLEPDKIQVGARLPRQALQFDPAKVAAGFRKIKAHLEERTPVRIPLIRGTICTFGKNHKIVPHHYVGIVGYKDNTFLYIDPFLGYSYLENYAGRLVSPFLGSMVYDRKRGLLRCQKGNHAPFAHALGGPSPRIGASKTGFGRAKTS
jgi:hypothetical protein